jgi:uncharacterized protein (DUF305 family)
MIVRAMLPALAGAISFLAVTHDASSPASASEASSAAEAPYLAENGSAMKKMMADMAVKPSGDVDRDFVAMMVPHHQGAIDMAVAVLRYGHNAQLKRLAQEIVVTQQEEIAAMRLALGEPLPAPRASPAQAQPPQVTAMPTGMKMH